MILLFSKNACERANVAFPKTSCDEGFDKTNYQSCLLAVAFKALDKDSDRYLYTFIFATKSEHILTPLIQSITPISKSM